MLPVSLSYDHRIIDGAEAARFMVDLVGSIEGYREADVKAGL
jgi:pyruvate/2-oxoglutarate dehydrogenase complex dihydrolipoamide acyltransferase (E2) component